MENVEGLLLGEAWKYVQEIYRQLKRAGYRVKHWLCKGENMGVPQARHRVFFVGLREDVEFDLQSLDMSFNYEPVTYGEIKEGNRDISRKMKELFAFVVCGEKDFVKAWNRKNNPIGEGKRMYFNEIITYEKGVMQTIRAGKTMYDFESRSVVSDKSISNASTFPQDFDFCGNKTGYICGMSVPPVMIKRIVQRLIESGVFSYKEAVRK